MLVTDEFIFSASAKALETETDQGWRLHPGFYCSNHDHWNPENTWHLTLTCESLWYRTLQTMQKPTVACSIYIFDNSPWTEMNDETTEPPNHPNLSLSKDVETYENRSSQRGSTLKTWSLKSWEHLRTNICKYETITFNSDLWIV